MGSGWAPTTRIFVLGSWFKAEAAAPVSGLAKDEEMKVGKTNIPAVRAEHVVMNSRRVCLPPDNGLDSLFVAMSKKFTSSVNNL